jgi:tRNA(Ile)-lysidine synthetase-like protein
MMKILWPKPGKYIVAVSGGVDSVVLLDMLARKGEYELIVAHVDHGIREDSAQDTEMVRRRASEYKLYFDYITYNFTQDTSEEELRRARYDFLFQAMRKHDAVAVVTAHHADDLLETSIMNVRRGTDRYGAAGGMTRQGIIRPLINVTKQELLDYAQEHKLEWHEDSTNTDLKYTRNKIRHDLIPSIDIDAYRHHVEKLVELNKQIDDRLARMVSVFDDRIISPRETINQLSLRELEVLLAYALRQARPGIELSSRRIAGIARHIMLGTDKISFSISAQDCIIIDIP